jgi:pimeloyl-ACP methyl ester carboxylesterase
MRTVPVPGAGVPAELCVDPLGDPRDPAVLLVGGMGASMDRWPRAFCDQLVAAGRHVVRYDHRDTGGSTTWPPGHPGYTGADLRADVTGVLDALGLEAAHLVGISMGAALAQEVAIGSAERVLSLTLLSTSPAVTGGPPLPGPTQALAASFAAPVEPDWDDRAAAVEALLAGEEPYAGARGLDVAETRALVEAAYDRSPSPASAGNHALAEPGAAPYDWARLAALTVPTLVVHGTDDPLFPLPHGEALAAAVPGARLVVVEGLGHELPAWAWPQVVPEVVAHTSSDASR